MDLERTANSAERLEENLGISENTNRALELATGDFIACIDHDDLLAPFALYEMARAIRPLSRMRIFSTAMKIDGAQKAKRHAPFFKPEWSPELLWASMYLGSPDGLPRVRWSMQVGRFSQRVRSLAGLRFCFARHGTGAARFIISRTSFIIGANIAASGSVGGKPDARKTNLAALEDAMRRRNLPAEIIEYPTANRARLMVSAVAARLRHCADRFVRPVRSSAFAICREQDQLSRTWRSSS